MRLRFLPNLGRHPAAWAFAMLAIAAADRATAMPAHPPEGEPTHAAAKAPRAPGPQQSVLQPGGGPHRAAAEPVEFVLSPMAPSVPALKYRLLPSSAELNPGDAAPIYLRLRHELAEGAKQAINDMHEAWIDKPLGELPVAQLREFFTGSRTRLLGFAARRERCDWNFTLREERRDAINILLPDTQEMRMWSRLLTVKTRAEIADGRFDDAIPMIETGIAFGRHVAEGPFLINALVGMAIAGQALGRVEELIAQPKAPNLYWALTALPTPLIDLRKSLETEQRLGENMVPEFEEVDREHSRAEWAVLLEKMDENLKRLARKLIEGNDGDAALKARLDLDVTVPALKEEVREPAIRWLREVGGFTGGQVASMSDDERVARYLAGTYRQHRDAWFKAGYLPYPVSRPFAEEAEAAVKELKDGPLGVFAAMFPSVQPARGASARVDRHVAALRVVEAIRAYAASHDGQLPETLGDIQDLPIPLNPATGQPFDYRREGEAARLQAPAVGGVERTALDLKLTIRK